MIRCILSLFLWSLISKSIVSENCLSTKFLNLNITHCGWETENRPVRLGNEVFGLEGVYTFTDDLHLVNGTYNTKYITRKDDAVMGESLRELGAWEDSFQYEVSKIMEAMNRTQGSLYIDIGSNLGVWSMFMSRTVGSSGWVISFEPQLHLLYQHSAALLLNNFKNSQIINAFVSNRDGYSNIDAITDADSLGIEKCNYATLNANSMQHTENGNKPHYSIPNLQLDHLYYRDNVIFKCPAFIKIDIESFEVHALLGGEKMLRECMPVLFVEAECLYLLRSLLSLLDDIGYTLAWVARPFINVDTPFHGRKVNLFPEGGATQEEATSMAQLYMSRNIIAVPSEYSYLVSSQSHFVKIDIHNERKRDPDTWHSIDQHEVYIETTSYRIQWRSHPFLNRYNSEKLSQPI